MMIKKTKRKKKQQARQTNWQLIAGIVVVGVLALFGLLALSLQEPDNLTLNDYCQRNPTNCIVKGAANAPVTIIEVSDFGCPHCRDFHQQTWPSLATQYIDTGQVRWLSLPYALRTETMAAANAAMCAEEQDGYFTLGQALFAQPDQLASLTKMGFLRAATAVGLDTAVFQQCLDEGHYTLTVLDNMAAAQQAGVSATPTFFINGRKLEGAYPFSVFQQQIVAQLGS